MAKVGRPTKYRPQFCLDLITHMKGGGSVESFCAFLSRKYEKEGIKATKTTLYEWFMRYPEFANAKVIGEHEALEFWEGIGKAGVTGQLKRVVKETYGPDGRVIDREFAPATFGQAAWIFTMKNRFRWRDRTEIVDPNNEPESFSALMKRIAEEEKKK